MDASRPDTLLRDLGSALEDREKGELLQILYHLVRTYILEGTAPLKPELALIDIPPEDLLDRLRQAPVGHYFDVMTNGLGAMPDYAAQLEAHDRWAVVAYIRALQLSQRATTAEVPPEEMRRLEQPRP